MSPALFTEIGSLAAGEQTRSPRLSILIPFHRDNPTGLLESLESQAGDDTEVILLDDGAPDHELTLATIAAVREAACPARLIIARRNLGRAAGRNHLARAARGSWLLYLDADMTIAPGFVAGWLALLDATPYDAVFGGFTPPTAIAAKHRVHAALTLAGDVHTAAERTRLGASSVCSSNLLVRAELMQTVPFDEGFRGWGWEDVDWAVRAAQVASLGHADNPAAHEGLQTPEELLEKFESGGRNFARFLARNPSQTTLPGARAAALIRRLRLARLTRLISHPAARLVLLPVRARVLALKLYRAACAAEALS